MISQTITWKPIVKRSARSNRKIFYPPQEPISIPQTRKSSSSETANKSNRKSLYLAIWKCFPRRGGAFPSVVLVRQQIVRDLLVVLQIAREAPGLLQSLRGFRGTSALL